MADSFIREWTSHLTKVSPKGLSCRKHCKTMINVQVHIPQPYALTDDILAWTSEKQIDSVLVGLKQTWLTCVSSRIGENHQLTTSFPLQSCCFYSISLHLCDYLFQLWVMTAYLYLIADLLGILGIYMMSTPLWLKSAIVLHKKKKSWHLLKIPFFSSLFQSALWILKEFW